MCNRHTIRGTAAELIEHFDATLPMEFDLPADDVVPGHLAPGLLLNRDGERELVPMQFGLAKAGAPAPFDRKWPNNNARIEKFDKWPCKTPFQQHRCVVPLSEFREPCYWGETAGGSTCVPTVSALLDKDGKLGRLRRPPVQQGRTAMAAGMDVNSWNLSVFAEASELAPHGT